MRRFAANPPAPNLFWNLGEIYPNMDAYRTGFMNWSPDGQTQYLVWTPIKVGMFVYEPDHYVIYEDPNGFGRNVYLWGYQEGETFLIDTYRSVQEAEDAAYEDSPSVTPGEQPDTEAALDEFRSEMYDAAIEFLFWVSETPEGEPLESGYDKHIADEYTDAISTAVHEFCEIFGMELLLNPKYTSGEAGRDLIAVATGTDSGFVGFDRETADKMHDFASTLDLEFVDFYDLIKPEHQDIYLEN